jgi:hypothetical protein
MASMKLNPYSGLSISSRGPIQDFCWLSCESTGRGTSYNAFEGIHSGFFQHIVFKTISTPGGSLDMEK